VGNDKGFSRPESAITYDVAYNGLATHFEVAALSLGSLGKTGQHLNVIGTLTPPGSAGAVHGQGEDATPRTKKMTLTTTTNFAKKAHSFLPV
jgi:hypothetical protein